MPFRTEAFLPTCSVAGVEAEAISRSLRSHEFARNIRLAVMIIIVGLLLTANIMSYTIDIGSYSLQPSDAMFCAFGKSKAGAQVDYFTTVWLIYAFTTRSILVCRKGSHNHSRVMLLDLIKKWIDPGFTGSTAQERFLDRLSQLDAQKRVIRQLCILYLACLELTASFTYEIIWLIFSFSYGVRLSAITWQFCYKQEDESTASCLKPALEMGFGQIVPLVLLLLPLLSWADSFHGSAVYLPLGPSLLSNQMAGNSETESSTLELSSQAPTNSTVSPSGGPPPTSGSQQITAIHQIETEGPPHQASNANALNGASHLGTSHTHASHIQIQLNGRDLIQFQNFVIILSLLHLSVIIMLAITGLVYLVIPILIFEALHLLDEVKEIGVVYRSWRSRQPAT